MSRVGNKSIQLPEKVSLKVAGSTVQVEGPKGKLDWALPEGISLSEEDGAFTVERADDSRHLRAMHGTARSLIANMVQASVSVKRLQSFLSNDELNPNNVTKAENSGVPVCGCKRKKKYRLSVKESCICSKI